MTLFYFCWIFVKTKSRIRFRQNNSQALEEKNAVILQKGSSELGIKVDIRIFPTLCILSARRMPTVDSQ